MAPQCETCNKTESEVSGGLKRCAKCKESTYCSVECQKADWKIHKIICGKIQRSNTFAHPVSKYLEMHISSPFTRLENKTYLHGRPEKDVFKLLIDSFGIREADQAKFGDGVDGISVHNGSSSSISGFREFLTSAAKKKNLLPLWWTADKQKECEEYAMDKKNASNVKTAVGKQDLIDRYGDEKMPMQLRMFSDLVYGPAPWAPDGGLGMRLMLMKMESGDDDGMVASILRV